jgi:hypothetical protein
MKLTLLISSKKNDIQITINISIFKLITFNYLEFRIECEQAFSVILLLIAHTCFLIFSNFFFEKICFAIKRNVFHEVKWILSIVYLKVKEQK